jgi:predicted GNAT family N-acyltransferase
MNAIIVRRADWDADGNLIRAVRQSVFIVEQNVPAELDFDGSDVGCVHVLALDAATPVGTGRLDERGRIGRMAVLREYRRRRVGSLLMEALIEIARERGLRELHLHSQTHANAFYARFGFVPAGDEFLEAGIPHVRMTRRL